jgi:tRNA-binding protein
MQIKQEIAISDFEKIDIRLGKIVEAEDFPEARTPRYKLWIDFGTELGVKKSTAALVGAHTLEELKGMLVCCVVNFPPRQVGPFMSEVLTLGFTNIEGEGFILISPSKATVCLGDHLA